MCVAGVGALKALGDPLSQGPTRLLSVYPPAPLQSLARSFPLCPRHPAEGWEGVVSQLPPTTNTTRITTRARQKSAPPLLADGLSSCDSVLPAGGRAGDWGQDSLGTAYFPPSHHPQVKGAEVFV